MLTDRQGPRLTDFMSDLIRFRCRRCEAPLKATASKSGTAVTCPKCREELIIPARSDDVPAGPSVSVGTATSGPAYLDPVKQFLGSVSSNPAPLAQPRAPDDLVEPATGGTPAVFPLLDLRLEPDKRPPPARPAPPALPPVSTAGSTEASPVPPALPFSESPPDEPVSLLTERKRTLRARDVNLPRTAVVAWSFAFLLSTVLAFIAGLLTGRFLWTGR